jgi:hypothetical protein
VSLEAGRKLVGLPGWVWLIPAGPESALLLALAWSRPRHRLEQMGHRRTAALALVGVITAANALALIALIASLLSAQEKSGGELLLKGAMIWSTNVITFGLLFWEFDRGGPIRRRARDPPPHDFQFSAGREPDSRRTRLASAPGRLRVHLVHERNRVQPHGRDAADPTGEDDDAG